MSPSKQETPRIWTVAQVLKWTQERFSAAGLPTPRLDAELILAHSLGWPRVSLYTSYDQPLSPEELARFRDLLKRRLSGEPVAYLTGQREFWSILLQVTPAVLVPRPETETLVEVALRLLDRAELGGPGDLTVHYDEVHHVHPDDIEASGAGVEAGEGSADRPEEPAAGPAPGAELAPAGPLVADIGTGSGAVALAIKRERPRARVVAVDVSEAALAVARDNARRLGIEVELLQGDLLEPLGRLGKFDLIVSNPPYIPSGELARLSAEVRAEPVGALDGGPDGLVVIRRLIQGAADHLQPGGALALEVGDGQAEAVAGLLRRAGYGEVALTSDLARVPRVVSGRRP